jgi:hypothetical protein
MDNDPIWQGFKGMLSCDFTGGIKVEANAILGLQLLGIGMLMLWQII